MFDHLGRRTFSFWTRLLSAGSEIISTQFAVLSKDENKWAAQGSLLRLLRAPNIKTTILWKCQAQQGESSGQSGPILFIAPIKIRTISGYPKKKKTSTAPLENLWSLRSVPRSPSYLSRVCVTTLSVCHRYFIYISYKFLFFLSGHRCGVS